MFIRPQLKQNSFTKFRKGRIRGVTQPVSLKYNCVVGFKHAKILNFLQAFFGLLNGLYSKL